MPTPLQDPTNPEVGATSPVAPVGGGRPVAAGAPTGAFPPPTPPVASPAPPAGPASPAVEGPFVAPSEPVGAPTMGAPTVSAPVVSAPVRVISMPAVIPTVEVPRTVELAQRIRQDCLAMTSRSGAGHIASALSVVDILAVLYGSLMHVDPKNPKDPERDRFILSKGHAGSAVYATLAELGFFDRNDLLANYYADGSSFSGHVSHDVPGVELTTGSLGQGLGVACGLALAARLRGESWHTYCVVGDGECDEGNIWESALMAATMNLDRLTVVVDRNGMQSFGPTEETALVLGDVARKFRSFGWKAIDCDGHDHRALTTALTTPHGGQPLCVVAHTTKGKGVSFMENDIRWHYEAATPEQLHFALNEVAAQRNGFPAGTAFESKEGEGR